MSRRPASRVVGIVFVFVVALVGTRLGNSTREARAGDLTVASIFVPPGGLVFRATEDGKPIARLSRDSRGAGVLVLYDAKQEPTLRMPAATLDAVRSPDDVYTDEPEDPFVGQTEFRSSINPPRATPKAPGPGF